VDSILVDNKGKKVSLRQGVDMWDKKFKGHKINRPQFKSFKKAHSKQVGDLIMPREYDLLKKAKGKEVFLKGGIYQGELKLNGFYSLKDVKKTKEGYRVPYIFDKYNLYV